MIKREFMLPFAAVFMQIACANAHDFWDDQGSHPVPSWVKQFCCGDSESHRLKIEDVHPREGYYWIDGFGKIPSDRAFPSQDGNYWLFWSNIWSCPDGPKSCELTIPTLSNVTCFFAPVEF